MSGYDKEVGENIHLRMLQDDVRLEVTGYLAAENAMYAASKELRRRDERLWRETVVVSVKCDIAAVVGHMRDDDSQEDLAVREKCFREILREIETYVSHECGLRAHIHVEMPRDNPECGESSSGPVSDEVLKARESLPHTLGNTESDIAAELLAARRVLRELAKYEGSFDEASYEAVRAFVDYRDSWRDALGYEVLT